MNGISLTIIIYFLDCTMGYDKARFVSEVAEDLMCPICTEVLEDPQQVIVVQL